MLKRVSLLLIVFVFAITSCGDASMRRKLWEIIRPNPEIRFYRSKSLNVGHWMTVETPQGNELQVFEHGEGVEGGTAIVFRSGRLGTNMRSVSHDPFKYAWGNITVEIYPQNVGWWLYPPYEPTSPDYPYLLWMTTNPPKRFLVPPDGAIPVSTPEDLNNIRNNPSGYYYLTNDIDMSNWGAFSPILGFTGVLDGIGFTIKNLRIGESDYGRGLIGTAMGNPIIRNIRLENVKSSNSESYCGGLVGFFNGDKLTISKIYVSGDIYSQWWAGGVVGRAVGDADLSYVYFTGNVSGGRDAGGIIGNYYDWKPPFPGRGPHVLSLYRCWTNGTITAGWEGAGLVGNCAIDFGDSSISLSECVAMCDVVAEESCAGAIVVTFSAISGSPSVNISDCFSRGTVRCNQEAFLVGGLLSLRSSGGTATVENCYAACQLFPKQWEYVNNTTKAVIAHIDFGPTAWTVESCYYDQALTYYQDDYALPIMRRGFLPPDWSTEAWDIRGW